MEIIQERLEREYDLDLVFTAPSVEYEVTKTDGSEIVIDSPVELPDPTEIAEIREPWVQIDVFTPTEFIGQVMDLVTSRRGEFKAQEYLDQRRVLLSYHIPLIEILTDFYNDLKARTRGYASLDYHMEGYRPADMVRLDVLVNKDPVDALSMIVHRDQVYTKGMQLVSKLKDVIPRQQFDVPIQAAVGNKVVSRANVKAMRKDVLAKCYGGDITRKRKLLEKQKAGKKRMKMIGNGRNPAGSVHDDPEAGRGLNGEAVADGLIAACCPCLTDAARELLAAARRRAASRSSVTRTATEPYTCSSSSRRLRRPIALGDWLRTSARAAADAAAVPVELVSVSRLEERVAADSVALTMLYDAANG